MEYAANFDDKHLGIKNPLKAAILVLFCFIFSPMLLIFLQVDFFHILLFHSILFFSLNGYEPLFLQSNTSIKMDDMELMVEKQFAFYKKTRIIPLHKVKSTSLKISGENLLILQYQEAGKDKSIQLCRFKKDNVEKILVLLESKPKNRQRCNLPICC